MSEAIQKAIDNLNAAFGFDIRLPIMDVDVRNLADLAELRGRNDIADCLRDALQLEMDLAKDPPCVCAFCLEQAKLTA